MATADDEPKDRRSHARSLDYRWARIAMSFVLGVAILVIVAAGVAEPREYKADPVVLGIIGGLMVALLGLTVSERVIRG